MPSPLLQPASPLLNRRDFLAAVAAIATTVAQANAAERAQGADFDPVELDIATLQGQLGRGLTAASLVTAYLHRIEALDRAGPAFRSVIAVNPQALEAARLLDAERRAGKLRGPLHGIPILLKDNIATLDPMPTTAGSLALARSFHAVDAPLVAQLRKAGAVILGKTNLSEWANFRSTNSTSGWSAIGGQTGNAYDPARNPSGSSSGSATAAALSFCAAAVGTETDGSILSPSAMAGLVGFKPSVGAVSGSGIVPLSPRQDVAGPMARSVADVTALAAVLFEPSFYAQASMDPALAGKDPLRVGIVPPAESMRPEARARYLEAIAVWRRCAADVVDVPLPAAFAEAGTAELTALLYEFKAAIDAYLAGLRPGQTAARSLQELVEFNQRHAAAELQRFGQELFEMALAKGPLTDAAYVDAVSSLRQQVDADGLDTLFRSHRVDVLVAPGSGPADLIDPTLGDRPDNGGSALGSAAAIAGYPSLTLPIGLVRGLPVGMTVVAPRRADLRLLHWAGLFEREGRLRVPSRFASRGQAAQSAVRRS